MLMKERPPVQEEEPMRLARPVLCVCLLVAVLGCAPTVDVTEQNKQVVMDVVEAINDLRYDDLDHLIAQTYHRHCQATPDVSVETLDDFKALMKGFEGAFSDAQVEIYELIAEGDLVAVIGTYRGTHTGQMAEFAATGKTLDSEFAGYHRFEDGKIVETWVTWDNQAMLQQLGLFPPAPAEGDAGAID
jgi:steroid delta-isomerase-like uncharacterized protein